MIAYLHRGFAFGEKKSDPTKKIHNHYSCHKMLKSLNARHHIRKEKKTTKKTKTKEIMHHHVSTDVFPPSPNFSFVPGYHYAI